MRNCSYFVTIFLMFEIFGHASVDSSPDADAVRFPGSANFRSDPLIISPCPKGENFCDGIDDYPNNVNVDDGLLSNELIKQKIFDDKYKPPINTRFGGGEKRACAVKKNVVYPKKAKNSKGQFVFIVNDNQYRQAVEIEQCLNEDQTCLTDDDAPYSRSTLCKQKYATYKFYAINSDREQVYDSFSLPSACLCHYKSPNSFRSNIQTRTRRNNLPFCKAGTKLSIQNNANYFPTSLPQKQANQQQVFRPIFEPQQSRPSISGRQPSQKSERQGNGVRPISGGQFDGINREFNQNRRFGQQRNVSNQRRRRNHQSRNRYTQNQRRNRRWQRDTRRGRESTNCKNPQSSFSQSPQCYPSNNIRQLLRNNADVSGELYKQVFDSQCTNTNTIATRGFAIDEDQLCSGRQHVIFPRKAKNMDNKWRFVVNIDNFTQSIEVEECDDSFVFNAGSSKEFGVCLYSGSEGNNPALTSCRQIYTEHKLLALTEAGNLEVDRFRLPSACACFVNSRFGLQQF